MAKKENKTGLSAGNNSVVIGGSVQGSTINHIVSHSSINIAPLFDEIYKKVEEKKDLKPQEKEDVQAELKEVQLELEKPEPDDSFLARRFRNIKRMAPDIADIAMETLKNPISGVVEIIKKVSKKVAEEAGAK
jgi:hypothetical protein